MASKTWIITKSSQGLVWKVLSYPKHSQVNPKTKKVYQMKLQTQSKQKVRGVIKHHGKQSIYIVFFLIIHCFSSCKTTYNKENHKTIKFSITNGTYLIVQLFDFYNRTDSLPGFINVNGIYIDSDYEKFYHPLKIDPGKYNIKGYYISKEPSGINGLTIDKNDSLIVKLYLKDSSEILWD